MRRTCNLGCADSPNSANRRHNRSIRRQTRKFAGRILKIPVSKSAQKSEIEIIAKNAWSYLEETVYQQTWTRAVNGTPSAILRSRVSLGQNSAGEKISVGEQLEEILAYAVSCGAQFAIGTIDIDSPMLIDEACDLSCAQAVAKVLKWSPNSSVYFDYDCDGLPRINIKKRSALDSAPNKYLATWRNIGKRHRPPRPQSGRRFRQIRTGA